MSELLNAPNGNRNFHLRLLGSASAVALSAVAAAGSAIAAEQNADRPVVWIELGGQAEQVNGFGDPFAPPFASELVADGFTSPLKAQHALGQSFGEEGMILFQPENSDWIFSASIRYGRAGGGANKHQQTKGGPRKACIGSNCGYLTPAHSTVQFSETRVKNEETNVVLDFQAGRDLGLGLFGNGGKSRFGFGVRIAQFSSTQTLGMNADPDFYYPTNVAKYANHHHSYSVTSRIDRSFRGFGPSLSWNASASLIGNSGDGGVALDWGVNAALLFGRQKAQGHHQTTGVYYKGKFFKYENNVVSNIHRSGSPDRSHSLIVPNVGGFAGVSFLYSSAKVSLGYRADLFFGATDSGIDTAKKENVGFYGPFATISIGLGG
jgi:iron complex outermembrane receptor protein